MKQKTTFSLWKRLLLVLVLLVPLVHSFGQNRIDGALGEYGKIVNRGVIPGPVDEIIDPSEVNNFDNGKYAVLQASPGLAIGLGKFQTYMELVFPKNLKANQTSYVRLDPEDKLLDGLIGGSLGGLLTKTLGIVLLGNQEFEISAKKGSSLVLSADSSKEFKTSTGNVRVIKDKKGEYYLAITPNMEYDRIRLENRTGSLVGLGNKKDLKVYHAFTYDDFGADCGKPIGTSFDGSKGLNLDVLKTKDLGLHYAIDDNINTYSTLIGEGLLSVGVASSLSQMFYFPTSSDEKASVNIKLDLGGKGLLSLELLGGVEILAYDGDTEVYKNSLSGGLISDLNLLELIKKGEKVDITVAPGRKFDRIEVKSSSLVGLGLINESVRIYDVERFDGVTCKNPLINEPKPTDQPFEIASCSTTLGDFENVNFAHNAVDGNNESFAILSGSSKAHGSLELKYDSSVSANTTSYIRIDTDNKELLDGLLKGTLGKLLGGVVGSLLGDHIITVKALDENGQLVVESSSINGFEGEKNIFVRLVQDNIGRYYLAVTPNKEYKSVVVINQVKGLLNTGEKNTELKVYDMCTEIGTDLCYPAQFTSYGETGLTIGIGNLGTTGVTNPYYAIDANSSNYAEINNGLVGIAGSVNHTIYFTQPTKGDDLKVRLQFDPKSLLSLDVLGGYKIVTFLGSEKKETFTLQQGLINNLNILDLLKSGGIQTLTFSTKEDFDRVDIQVSTVLGVKVGASVRVYEVKRISEACPEKIGQSPFSKPVCATTVLGASNVDDVDNLFSENYDAYATLNSGAGALLGLGDKYSGYVELGYDNVIPAGITSYVRFDFDDSILEKLIGGSLGNVVTGLVDKLILGDHYFEVAVKDENGMEVLKSSSKGNDTTYAKNGIIRIVLDKAGRTYIAITPTVPYKSVRITDITNSALGLLAKPNTMNIYSMCYESDTSSCIPSFATSYEFNGLALDVKDLSGAGVQYPERAIDDNSTNYSEISSGTLKIAGAVRQYIYFNNDAKPGEETLIRFKTQGGDINVGLVGAIEIKAYKGEVVVDSLESSNGLINGINVLDLLTTNKMVELPFRPNAAYDKVSVGLKELVGISVGASLHLYDVSRSCRVVDPNQSLIAWKSYKVNGDATVDTVLGGEEVEYTIHVRNQGSVAVNGFLVKDKLPEGLTFKSSANGVVVDNELIITDNDILNPGETKTYTFTVDVNVDLKGLFEIRNIAFVGELGQEEGKEVYYPSFPPIDNTKPIDPDGTKAPGTVLLVSSNCTKPKAEITSDIAGGLLCEGSNIILTADVAGADVYQWYYEGQAMVGGADGFGTKQTLETNAPGNYTVSYIMDDCISEMSDVFTVTQLDAPVITITGDQYFTTIVGMTVTWPEIKVENGVTLKYYNSNYEEIGNLPESFGTAGQYTFFVVAENKDGCTSVETFTVTVLDDADCPPSIVRVYADDSSSWGSIITGGVSGIGNSIDGNPTTHSRITTGLGLLGIGTTWQNIYFDHVIPAGTPVSIKLGKEYSGLVLAGGLSVQGLDANGNTIGTLKPVAGGLLDLLSADDVAEFTFVPSDRTGAKAYKGVRVSQGSLLGVAQIAKVYSVFYTSLGQLKCDAVTPDTKKGVEDVYHGVGDIGLGVASSLSGVYNPWNAVDNDLETHATMSRVLGVANQTHMTVIFKQQSMPTDELHIITKIQNNPLLSLELVKGYKVQRYLGNKKVGDPVEGSKDTFLDLTLLGLNYKNKYKFVVAAHPEPFDRIKITYTSLVAALAGVVEIYDVSLTPKIDPGYVLGENYVDMCFGGILELTPIDGCTDYEVFRTADEKDDKAFERVDPNSMKYRLPSDLETVEIEVEENGSTKKVEYHVVYVQVYRNGCAVDRRVPVYLDMKNCAIKSNLNVTTKINY